MLLGSYGCYYNPGTLTKAKTDIEVSFQCRDVSMRERYMGGVATLCASLFAVLVLLMWKMHSIVSEKQRNRRCPFLAAVVKARNGVTATTVVQRTYAPRCKQGGFPGIPTHDLVTTDRSPSSYSRYECSTCGVHQISERWHCVEHSEDICYSCWNHVDVFTDDSTASTVVPSGGQVQLVDFSNPLIGLWWEQ